MTAERVIETRYLLNPATKTGHDTWYLTENCNTDDIVGAFAKPALPEGYTLCGHCRERRTAVDDARRHPEQPAPAGAGNRPDGPPGSNDPAAGRTTARSRPAAAPTDGGQSSGGGGGGALPTEPAPDAPGLQS